MNRAEHALEMWWRSRSRNDKFSRRGTRGVLPQYGMVRAGMGIEKYRRGALGCPSVVRVPTRVRRTQPIKGSGADAAENRRWAPWPFLAWLRVESWGSSCTTRGRRTRALSAPKIHRRRRRTTWVVKPGRWPGVCRNGVPLPRWRVGHTVWFGLPEHEAAKPAAQSVRSSGYSHWDMYASSKDTE